MTRRGLLAVVAVGVALAAAVLILEGVLPERRRAEAERRAQLVSPGQQPEALVLEKADDRIELARRPDGTWGVTARSVGREVAADLRFVEQVLAELSAARVRDVAGVDGGTPADLAQYGLGPPLARLEWRLPDGARHALGVGTETPGGGAFYALLDDRRLVLVPPSLAATLALTASDFRLKTVLAVPWDAAERLEIVRRRDVPPGAEPGTLVLEREPLGPEGPSTWRVLDPDGSVDAPAEEARVGAVLSRLGGLLAAGFGPEQPTPDDLATAGLAPPAVTVSITTASATATLDLGAPGEAENTVWARAPGGPLVLVRLDLRDDLLREIEWFRDSRTFRLPRVHLANLHVWKGAEGQLDVEIQADPVRGWHVVRPADADLPDSVVKALLDDVYGLRAGRFEDALAADVAAADRAFDFQGPGSFRLDGAALLPGGRTITTMLEVGGPFTVDGEIYLPVRTTDWKGRLGIGIVMPRSADDVLERFRDLRDRALEAARARGEDPLPR